MYGIWFIKEKPKPCSVIDQDNQVWAQFGTLFEAIPEQAWLQKLFTEREFRVVDDVDAFNHMLGRLPSWQFQTSL